MAVPRIAGLAHRLIELSGITAVLASLALADEAVITRRATLRGDPSTAHRPIRILTVDDQLELLETVSTNGYYHVRTEGDGQGWVYGRNLRILRQAGPSPSPSTTGDTPPHSGRPAPSTSDISDSVSPDWEKPEPNSTTFHGFDGTCGPSGDGGDQFTNVRKNRTDIPSSYHDVTWRAVANLPYPVAGRSLDTWTVAQKAQIMPFEGTPVRTVGYLVAIKVEDRGSGESTNCHFVGAAEVDWHMPLVQGANEGEKTSIVVETTPRIRQNHPKWTPEALSPWVNSDAQVRISGYLLLDPEHRPHLGVYRSTLWEIHPVTRIEVFHDNAWVDLDQLQ